MSLTTEERVEKIARKLFLELDRVSDLNDSVRDAVYTRVIEKLNAIGKRNTSEGIRKLRSLSLGIGESQ